MGLDFGILTKIVLGFGLGILTVSCLVVTVCFGAYANNTSSLENIEYQLSFNEGYSLYSASLAIAVLGCIAAAAALGAMALSILMDDQTLILIIVGGVSALFAFGCIVAEGMYTLQATKFNYYDDDSRLIERNHKNAQKYIKEAIEKLYNQGVYNLQKYLQKDDLPDWNSVKSMLGSVSKGRVFTYADIWTSENLERNKGNITLYYYNGMIKACYHTSSYSSSCYNVASLYFYTKVSFQYKHRVCWYKNKEKTDLKCANVKGEKVKNAEFSTELDSDYFLNENIVVGNYLSESDVYNSEDISSAKYEVRKFPFAYKILTYEEIEAIKEQEEGREDDEDGDDYHDPYSFKDSTKHFKVSGKKYINAVAKDHKKSMTKPGSYRLDMLVPSKPKDYADVERMCENYNEKEDENRENDYVCSESASYSDVFRFIQKKYKDGNKGKIASAIKKHYMSEAKSYLKPFYYDISFLYQTALINLIIQIFGILFWACGRFLGLVLGGGGADAKTPSAGEA
ncbi:hypothetical protein M9Y10_032877 [Tritrichomonas musculus]|uniref:Tetraspanin family protein n=1 Tax=Tritrichomonas musculus TaxID=1915356 RepID=A0ABR2GY25_9EUKA